MKNLNIPSKYRQTGLYVYCNKCKSYSNISKGCLKKSISCDHPPSKQVFKLKIHVPNTRNSSRTKILSTRDPKVAEQQRIEFIKLLEENSYNLQSAENDHDPEQDKYLLLYQMQKFIKYISNGGFYSFESPKELDKSTIKDYERNFKYFLQSIESQVDIHTLHFNDVQEKHIDIFHKFLLNKNYSRKTYNNIMGSMRAFYNHIIEYEEYDIRNPFKKVPVLSVHYNPTTFTKEEFERILSVTSLENGYDLKTKRNCFRSWLTTAFKFGIYTNLRLDELAKLKFSDIFQDDGIWLLKVNNIKVNALLGIADESIKRNMIIPVIPELHKVLTEECEFDKNQAIDQYIFDPLSSRETVYNIISKGFTHFKRVAQIDNNKSFKELRTTFTTALAVKYGEKYASLVTDHSSKDVVEKHYIEKISRAKTMLDFSPFETGDSDKH